ncbi:MAG: hypothetical protein GF307_13975 [candidate division Zixibacteria bacterium]|nr:hypothetical protein [candidate division Zixibacteria bacterium]
MQNELQEELVQTITSKLNLLGFVINLVAPAIILLIGYIVGRELHDLFTLEDDALTAIRWALIGVSVAEIVIAFLIKRHLFSKLDKYFPEGTDLKAAVGLVVKMMVIIHVLAATPALYGLLYYILGGGIDGFLLMIILNLIGFQLCRARKSDFDSLSDIIQKSLQSN